MPKFLALLLPRRQEWFNRYLPWIIFICAIIARLIPGTRTIDDAFITFRYARNILAGNGFVFNPGEHVLGTTTPLYTILLVLLGSITGGVKAPFPSLALMVNSIADGFTCMLLYKLGCRLGSPRGGLGAALVWAIAPFSVTFAIGGLETSVYVFLLVAILTTHLNQRYILAAFLASLALLTRPDALILIGPVALDRAWQLVRDKWMRNRITLDDVRSNHHPFSSFSTPIIYEILAFLIPTGIWLLFASYYFGSPIPHSIAAKSLVYHLKPTDGFVRLLQHYLTPFLDQMTFGIPWLGVGMVLYPFLFLVGSRQALRNTWRAWPMIAYPGLYFATFAMANPLIFRWYLTPPLPAYILLILIGADQVITQLSQFLSKRFGREKAQNDQPKPIGLATSFALIFFAILAPLALSLHGWTLHPDHGLDRPAPAMAWYQLELFYRQAADWLTPQIEQQAGELPVLAAGDVGVLGFFTPTRILDTVGLNSAQTISYYPLDPALYVINYAIPPDLILDEKPDYIVILEVYGRAGLLKDTRFWKTYTLLRKIPTDIYGSDGMLIFKRKT
jgi:arabinofuranosyltransferase